MKGFIEKKSLMDYCNNQVTRTIDLNDIARFPVSEVYTKEDVIAFFEKARQGFEDMEKYYEKEFKKPDTIAHEASMYGIMCGYTGAKEIIQRMINVFRGETDGQ